MCSYKDLYIGFRGFIFIIFKLEVSRWPSTEKCTNCDLFMQWIITQQQKEWTFEKWFSNHFLNMEESQITLN